MEVDFCVQFTPCTHNNFAAKRKSNITKADIGEPSHLHRIGHVGFDQEMEFDVISNDENGKEMNVFFKTAGTSVLTQNYLPVKTAKDNTGMIYC